MLCTDPEGYADGDHEEIGHCQTADESIRHSRCFEYLDHGSQHQHVTWVTITRHLQSQYFNEVFSHT